MADDIKTWDQLADEAAEEGVSAILEHRATWGDCLCVANRYTFKAARIKELEAENDTLAHDMAEIYGRTCPVEEFNALKARCEALEWLVEVLDAYAGRNGWLSDLVSNADLLNPGKDQKSCTKRWAGAQHELEAIRNAALRAAGEART